MSQISAKVLYLTMNPNRQSTTAPLEYWIEDLRGNGLEPVLVVSAEGDLARWARELKIPTYIINLSHPDKLHPLRLLFQILSLLLVIWKHKIKLIHCNEQNIFPIGKLLSNLSKLPIVVSVHFTMNLPFCQWAFSGAKYLKKIFFVSSASLELCKPNLKGVVDSNKWLVLKNAIKLSNYCYNSSQREQLRNTLNLNQKFLVGTACALRPRKQVEHLIQAVAKIESKDIVVLIAGNYLPEDRNYGENLINESKKLLGENVIFLGHLDDLVGFYSSLDLFVNTSVEEACSLSVLQSLACETPVIGYSSKETVSEQILPGGGEIVPQDDILALSITIKKFYNNPASLVPFRALARKRVEDDYDSKKQSEILMNVYQEILASGN